MSEMYAEVAARVENMFADPGRKKSERERALERRKMREMFKAQLSTREGREFVIWLLRHCHLFHTTFTGNSLGQFLEGKRAVGLKVLEEAAYVEPAFFANAIKEGIIDCESVLTNDKEKRNA